MSLHTLDELAEGPRAAAEDYLERVRITLCGVESDVAAETIEGLRAHLLEVLDPNATTTEARRVLDDLGEPDAIGADLCAILGAGTDGSEPDEPQGRFLGMPVEFLRPTAERFASRWWAPQDPHIFVPKVFGVGWEINFGALAVHLRLIEPDAEDSPFAKTPQRAFLAALMVPVALLAAILGSYLVVRASLPAQLPVHWGWDGSADNFAPVTWAFAPLAAISLASVVWAVWVHLVGHGPGRRGIVTAVAAFATGLSAAIWLLTLLSVAGIERAWLPPLLVVGSLLTPFGVLIGLARAGRRAEIERDIGGGAS